MPRKWRGPGGLLDGSSGAGPRLICGTPPLSMHRSWAPACVFNWRTRSGTVHLVAKDGSAGFRACDHDSQWIAQGFERTGPRRKDQCFARGPPAALSRWPPERYRMTEDRSPAPDFVVAADLFAHGVTGGFGCVLPVGATQRRCRAHETAPGQEPPAPTLLVRTS
jgi:hypothetical protein